MSLVIIFNNQSSIQTSSIQHPATNIQYFASSIKQLKSKCQYFTSVPKFMFCINVSYNKSKKSCSSCLSERSGDPAIGAPLALFNPGGLFNRGLPCGMRSLFLWGRSPCKYRDRSENRTGV